MSVPMKIDMRDAFFQKLVEAATNDPRIVFLTADHGAFALAQFEKLMPFRYINVGIAEQNMIGVAAGLASSGKIPFVYGIAPFVSLRVLEHLMLDVAAMNLPVNIVSVGAGFTYSTDGPSHHGLVDLPAVLTVPNLNVLNSSDPNITSCFVDTAINNGKPNYIRIEKGFFPNIGAVQAENMASGYRIIKNGTHTIVSTGILLHTVMAAVKDLESSHQVSFKVVDLYEINQSSINSLLKVFKNQKIVVSIEENYASGMSMRLGHAIALSQSKVEFNCITVPDQYFYEYGDREYVRKFAGIGKDAIFKELKTACSI